MLLQAVRGISDLIVHPGLINVDFADVKTIMSNMGRALMGTGYGKGKDRALDAARMAISSPLLDDVSVTGATGILLNFTAGPDVRLSEIESAANLVQEAAHEEANIIFGMVTDASMGDMVKVTVIATGFDNEAAVAQEVMTRPVQRGFSASPASRQPVAAPAPARNALQMRPVADRQTMAYGTQSSPPPVPRATPAQHVEHAVVSAQRSSGFAGSALPDERTLDIPAYLRRGSNGAHHE